MGHRVKKAPTRAQRLNFSNLGGLNGSTDPNKHRKISRLRILDEILNKWVERGYCTSRGCALEAQICEMI